MPDFSSFNPTLMHAVRIGLLVLLGFPLIVVLSRYVHAWSERPLSKHNAMLARKAVFYGGTVMIAIAVLSELDFKLTALLGAAGVVGIAVGFASQTSVSNIISGLFLIAERTFVVGDTIQVSGVLGTVLSIDLLSIKVRTVDNRYIRIPNEMVVKGVVTNITRLSVRRLDIAVGVPSEEDTDRVKTVLEDLARGYPACLDDPAPIVFLNNLSGASQEFFFAVWCNSTDFLTVRSSIVGDIRKRLADEGIAKAGSLTVKTADEPI